MTDETTALVQEPAEPAIEETLNTNVNEPAEPAIEGEELEGVETEGAEPAEEDDDLDFGFKKYRVPKSLKEGIEGLRRDYTQKTETLSHRTREFEQQRAAMMQASEEELGLRGTLVNLDQQLKQYQGVDWRQLRQEDPAAYEEHRENFQLLKEQREAIAGDLGHRQQQRLHAAQQETAKRLEATREAAQKIKGWTPEIDAKVTQFACQHLETTPEQLQNIVNPAIYGLLYKAWVGEQSIARQSAQPKPQQPAVKPLTTVKAKSPPVTGLSDKLDTSEWIKRRNAQLASG